MVELVVDSSEDIIDLTKVYLLLRHSGQWPPSLLIVSHYHVVS